METTTYPQLVDIKRTQFATKVVFLVCGLGLSSWAPMVPYVKDRLALDDAQIGLLLLFLGAGAIVMMPVAGWLISRIGTRNVMLLATLTMAVSLPLLLRMNSTTSMAVMLFIFGSGVGSIDVAMNAHGVQVQNLADKPIMSSLHGLFSVGGLFGSLGIGFLIKTGLDPLMAAICVAVLMLAIVLWQYGSLMTMQAERQVIRRFAQEVPTADKVGMSWLNGQVLFLGSMCFAAFLSEGAMLDWGAIFLRDNRGLDEALSGLEYACFSVAMAFMRLIGDRVISRLSPAIVVTGGSLLGAVGFLLIIGASWLALSLTGFVLVGIGAANIVPVFFSEGGRLRNVSSTVAISAITTIGYAGQLAGPAVLGFIAHWLSLTAAFGFTSLMLVGVGVAYFLRSRLHSVGVKG